jgi:hypothetical protein
MSQDEDEDFTSARLRLNEFDSTSIVCGTFDVLEVATIDTSSFFDVVGVSRTSAA